MNLLTKKLTSGRTLRPSLMKGMPGERSVFSSISRRRFAGSFIHWRNIFLLLFFWLLPSHPALGGPPNSELSQAVEAFGDEKPYAQGFYEKALQHQADPQWVSEVMGRAKAMRDQGLPTQPFFLKANEGLTKRVAPAKITPALNTTQRQIESAGELVNQAISRGAVVRSPEAKRQSILGYQRALMNEIPPGTLEKLSNRIDPQSRTKVRIDQLGGAAADFPKLKKKGLSDDQVLGNFEKKEKEERLLEKKSEALTKTAPEKPIFEKRPQNKFKEKEEKAPSPKKIKTFDPFQKGGPSMEGSPGKGHGHGHGKGD